MTFLFITVACMAGSTLSAALAAFVAWRIQPALIPLIVSYAVGALLGAVFLDVLPHIVETGGDFQTSATWILAGMLGFFMLEKMVLWRHDHDHAGAAEVASEHSAHAVSESHHHGAGRLSTAWMIIIGGAFHNFTDGLAIAAAFLVDVKLGVVTAIAIIAHELPQELGDFLVLIHSGFSRVRALVWNLVSSLATLLGATLAYAAIRHLQQYATIFLCLAAASMIYVAAADLIPGLHRRTSVRDSLMQIVLVGLGVGSIGLVRHLLGD